MPKNLGYELSYKSSNGYIPLHPTSIKSQIIGIENFGQSYGPFQLVLKADGWINSQQILSLRGVLPTDILQCIKILSGSQEEMLNQDKNFNLLDSYKGINSLTNQIQFTCTNSVPDIDLTFQVYWMR